MIPAQIAIVAWIPFVLLLFALMPARRAVFYSIIGGMLFLPEVVAIKIPSMFYGKMAAISIATFLGVLLFDGNRILSFRASWYDLFWVVLCGSSVVTSLDNGLGLKDGLVESIGALTIWGIPYFIGRIYLTDIHAVREAAVAVLVGAMIYAPLCLLEVRISPQLNKWVYGYYQHSFAQTVRFGGYRPMVFMQHGLAVGLFMGAASLIAVWLWSCGTLRQIWGIPMSWAAVFLIITTVLCKSTGGLLLAGMGAAVLMGVYYRRAAWPLILLIAVAPVYMVVRATGLFDGKLLVGAVAQLVNEDRAGSLKFRIDAEDVLSKKAMQKPLFGWGGWDRSRAMNANGVGKAVTDGLWIIVFGKKGIVGVVALFGTFLIGPLLLRKRYDPKLWVHPAVGPAVVSAVVVCIHLIDSLPNGMPNAIYYFLGGGLAGLAAYPRSAPVSANRVVDVHARPRPVGPGVNPLIAGR